MRSGWRSAGAVAALVLGALLGGGSSPAAAQDDEIGRACSAAGGGGPASECRLAVGAARLLQPRMGAALWGGNPVPGTASTLGMRIASMPRMSLAARLTVAPGEVAPLLDRTQSEGEGSLLMGLGLDGSVGVLPGFSPFATVGGLLSLDVIGRAGYVLLPEGFEQGGALGWALGARVGIFRESFTMPGLSLTGTYGRIGEVALGDPDGATTDGYFEGPVNELRLGAVASKRVALVDVIAGGAYQRYSSDLTVGYRAFPGAPQLDVSGEAVNERWSAYINVAWTLMIFQLAAELGWQEAPVPEGLPTGVELDPVGLYGGLAFRASI